MWKLAVLLTCLSGYCLAGPVGQKRNMPIVQQRTKDTAQMAETEPIVSVDANEMMIMSTLSLPSNATSIRADITDGFSCENKTYGYYADIDNDCQIFHVCLPVTYADGKENTFRWSFICPEDTIFSQDSFTCMRPDDMTITCDESYQYYELNRNFGMMESNANADKEASGEAAASVAAVNSNENISEAENESELIKPVVHEEKEQIIGQSKPVNVPKPSRRKPAISYSIQRKPVNSYPLRKMPQTPVQSQGAESSANHMPQNINDNLKPVEEEVKLAVNKFSRRPVISFIKEKMPETPINQDSSATTDNISPVEEEEIKPVQVHKFSRRPIVVINNSIRNKISNKDSKPENEVPSRTDLFNQLRKRPNLFNKKPVEQPEEENPVEQAKVEIAQEQQNFSPLAADMSNVNPATQMADAEIETSESSHVVLVKPQEANEMAANSEATNNMSEEPVQVLEAFEEIPAVISEVIETPKPEEDETHNEQAATISNVQSDNLEEPQIFEAVQSAEDTDTNDDVQQTPEAQEDHFADETQTVNTMPNAEENPIAEDTRMADELETPPESPAVQEIHEVFQSLRSSAEDSQGFLETEPNDEPLNIPKAEESPSEETQNVPEHPAAEEMQNIEDHQAEEETYTAEETPNVMENQAAVETQNFENHQVDEESHTAEEIHNVSDKQAAEEIPHVEDHQVADEAEIPEETSIEEDIKAEEETQIAEQDSTADEIAAADKVKDDQKVLPAEEVSAAEELSIVDKSEAEEEVQAVEGSNEEVQNFEMPADSGEHSIVESPINEEVSALEQNEASAESAEDTLKQDLKSDEEKSQSVEEIQPIQESFTLAEEPLLVEEAQPVIHQIEESLAPEELMHSTPTEEKVESENMPAALDSDNVDEPAISEQEHSEDSSKMEEAAQTIEQMESEKPAEAPEIMQPNDEMNQPQPLVQQMYDDMNMNKHSVKGFKPVDPVMAQEAEQLIVDFINTLRQNDFTNETPGMLMAHQTDETSAEQEIDSSMTEIQDEEKPLSNEENVEETANIEIAETPDEISAEADAEDEKQEEMPKAEEMDFAPENEAKQDTTALKLLENQSMENMDESQKSEESAAEAMNLPQEVYQIPVKIITEPAEEITHNEEQSPESEIKSNEIATKTEMSSHEVESPAVHMAGLKPLSIDDIVELVKERLDQMPKTEMETPMQLEHVLGEAQEDKKISEEDTPAATQAEVEQSSGQSVEETVVPIYQRMAEPIQIEDGEQSETLKKDSSAAEQPQVLEDVASETREKTNRSYKSKLDSRKRRFLFKADSS